MRTYERNGVHVDQCAECRGIFLDRGELELLLDLEARSMPLRRDDRDAFDRPDRPAWGAEGGWDRDRDRDRDRGFGMRRDRDDDDDDDDDRRRGGRRRGGFLSDLLDFD